MREMTEQERQSWYVEKRWPCCGGETYIPGPRGGMSMNIECPSCGMRINVIDPGSHWASHPGLTFGQVINEAPGMPGPLNDD